MKWLFNSTMIYSAVLGWLMLASLGHFLETFQYRWAEPVNYGDGQQSAESSERVAESQYKRHHYTRAGIGFGLAVFLWVLVARAAHNESVKNQNSKF